jgi:hypothetical protein
MNALNPRELPGAIFPHGFRTATDSEEMSGVKVDPHQFGYVASDAKK